jgi:hypothetical protein
MDDDLRAVGQEAAGVIRAPAPRAGLAANVYALVFAHLAAALGMAESCAPGGSGPHMPGSRRCSRLAPFR